MRIVALDCGDAWVGVAHTDVAQIICTPYAVWKAHELVDSLREYLQRESVKCVVIGMPYTMKGKMSAQTQKVEALVLQLRAQFPEVIFELQDERLSSKFAHKPKQKKSPKKSTSGDMEHARAAAIILRSFLDRLAMQVM